MDRGIQGAASSYPQYAATQGGYTQQGYTANTAQYAPPSGNVASYTSASPGYSQTPQDPPYNLVGTNMRASTQPPADPYASDPYGGPRDPRGDPRDQRIPVTSTMAPARTTYTTAGPASNQAFATGQNVNYYPPGAPTTSAPYSPAVQPGDPFYGRGAYTRGF